MNIDLEKEKKLLEKGEISIQEIRDELTDEYDDTDEYRESKISDEFKKYKTICDTFGEKIFTYDDKTKTITLNEKSKSESKMEHLFCIHLLENTVEQETTKIFENLVAESLKSYLGDESEYEIVDDFKERDIFCKLNEEKGINIDNTKKINPRCDLICWKTLDERVGKIVLLVQCKSGKKWRKGKGVNIRGIETIIDFASNPIPVYAITDLLSPEDIYKESKEKGLILDRKRIVLLLSKKESSKIMEIREKISEIINAKR